MLTAADKAQMQRDIGEVVADDGLSVVIRRGNTTLQAQTVRIVRLPRAAREVGNIQAGEVRADVLIVGDPSLDIRPGDRLNDANGTLYRVTFVRPSRMVATEAEAVAVE